jgi:hypothetical protein
MGKSSVPEAWLNPVGSPKFRADTCPLIFNWTQKKRHVVSFLIVRKVSVRFRNVVRLAFQARPFHRMKTGGAADDHFPAADHNHDVANPGSRITSDGNRRRREPLGHDLSSRTTPEDRPIPKSKCDCDSGYLMASRHLSKSPRAVCLIVQVGRAERQRCPVMKVPMVEPHFQEPRSQ